MDPVAILAAPVLGLGLVAGSSETARRPVPPAGAPLPEVELEEFSGPSDWLSGLFEGGRGRNRRWGLGGALSSSRAGASFRYSPSSPDRPVEAWGISYDRYWDLIGRLGLREDGGLVSGYRLQAAARLDERWDLRLESKVRRESQNGAAQERRVDSVRLRFRPRGDNPGRRLGYDWRLTLSQGLLEKADGTRRKGPGAAAGVALEYALDGIRLGGHAPGRAGLWLSRRIVLDRSKAELELNRSTVDDYSARGIVGISAFVGRRLRVTTELHARYFPADHRVKAEPRLSIGLGRRPRRP